MAKQTWSSRLNPLYLASRHAGVTFMLVAFGIAAGMSWRILAQPVLYSAHGETTAVPQPPGSSFDWNAKQQEWRDLLADPGVRALLSNNLRHTLKLSATRHLDLEVDRLPGELLFLDSGSVHSLPLLQGILGRIGPTLTIRTRDLAANMDFQSLAVVASDLDPPRDAGEWDFSFFTADPGDDGVLTLPGPDDRYFRVFYYLYSRLNPDRTAASPEDAWRAAVDEITARIERENRFAGGGGFGPAAKRELMREIVAVSILAANGLYGAGGWEYGGDDFGYETALWDERWENALITLRHTAGGEGLAGAGVGFALHPLAFPRDTALTRTPPLAVAAILSYLAGRETVSRPDQAMRTAPPVAPPPPVRTETRPSPPPRAEPRISAPVVREIIDVAASERRQEKISSLEQSLRDARLEHAALLRRLRIARENVHRIGAEVLAARERADRFKARYDAAAVREETSAPQASPETAKLLADRDALARRLIALLEYCTEEHPFVREVRRDMAAIDRLIGEQNPGAESVREAEIRATRLANLYLEWETASFNADSMDERLRRQIEAVDCLLRELEDLERTISIDESELTLIRETPTPVARIEEQADEPGPGFESEPVSEPEPLPPPAPNPEPPSTETAAAPYLRLAAPPTHIPLHRQLPDWSAVWTGLTLGLIAALATGALREIFAKRFYSAAEAKRLVGRPVLAVLDGYNAKSFRAAAKTMKGEVVHPKGGGMTFIPSPIDFAEPQPAARRGKIAAARRIPRVWPWLAGLLFLAAAAWLHHISGSGIAQPQWFRDESRSIAFSAEVGREQRENTP